VRVADHRLFLEIADDAVGRLGAQEIESKEEDIEHPLHADDHGPLEPGRLGNLDEGHEVHALIFGLVHERLDPALVVTHAAQAGEVVDRRTDHSGDRSDGLEHDSPVTIALGEKVSAHQRRTLVKPSATLSESPLALW
jgi:hypothetical protein